ncbi:type III-B CRISPR module RAMP protein Cmr6 [Marinimicrobium sp. ARAG 43.8]|uniref:type III-B CRISPR module RAMP protein Cmr6 n=1 Tax=Marinimicrobium sp. ARAG 43.8 TaxID=3418719 RepID=UPI003CED1F84
MVTIAAVPDYLGTDFNTASPGLRFGMYLQVWNNRFGKETSSVESLKRAGKLNDNDKKTMSALAERQQATFNVVADTTRGLQLDALATAPFTTGLGNEHPTENGFAFLNPYGLPYLPGSGVKGVLRQAARELASGEWGENHGWNDATITALFGLESKDGDSDHLRGALTFWDVIPQIKGDNSLTVEITTPHQKHYYQDGKTPHDSGQPIPISFLTVPPGSGFTFYLQCNLTLLKNSAPDLLNNNQWQTLLHAAFEHAFNWLGFGAKTAVGYGAMVNQKILRQKQEDARKESLKEAGIAMGSELWKAAEVRDVNPGSGEVRVVDGDGRIARGNYYAALSDAAKKRLKKRKKVLVSVEVEVQGNQFVITSINDAE